MSRDSRQLGRLHSHGPRSGFRPVLLDIWVTSFLRELKLVLGPEMDQSEGERADKAWRELSAFICEQMTAGYQQAKAGPDTGGARAKLRASSLPDSLEAVEETEDGDTIS